MSTYYDLIMRCPACIAAGKDGGVPRQWYHAGLCGGKLRAGDDACYKCVKCGVVMHVSSWRYKCDGHSDYRSTTSAHLANAVSTAGQLVNVAGRYWLMQFLENLGDW